MKRITSIALVLVLLVCSLAACGGSKPEETEVTPYEGAIADGVLLVSLIIGIIRFDLPKLKKEEK